MWGVENLPLAARRLMGGGCGGCGVGRGRKWVSGVRRGRGSGEWGGWASIWLAGGEGGAVWFGLASWHS